MNFYFKDHDQDKEAYERRMKIATEDGNESFNEEGEFVKGDNKDFREQLFGGKEKKKDLDDPTINFLTGQKYSEKFYDLLATRKILPAW